MIKVIDNQHQKARVLREECEGADASQKRMKAERTQKYVEMTPEMLSLVSKSLNVPRGIIINHHDLF